jgi:hypothetical protein
MADWWTAAPEVKRPAAPPQPTNRTSPVAQALAGPASAPPRQPEPRAPKAAAEAGIDRSRPILENDDGSFSTEETITIDAGGRFVNIPTIIGGRRVSEDQAVEAWRRGKNPAVGEAPTLAQAEKMAQERSTRIGQVRSGDRQGAEWWDSAPVVEAPTAAPAAPPTREVGFMESAGRTAAGSATPVVRALGLADAGVLEIVKQVASVADAIAPMFGLRSQMTQRVQAAQDEAFAAANERAASMRAMYDPQAGEEMSLPGQIAGGIASMPIEMVGGMGLQRGVERSADVLQRGGSGGEAALSGAAVGAVNVAANLLPIKAGGAAVQAVERVAAPLAGKTAARMGVGAVTGGALGAGADAAVTATENATLPEGAAFEDLKREASPGVAGGLGAALGALGGVRAPRTAPKAKPAAKPTPGTPGSAGAAGTDVATQRRERAAQQGIDLTKGQAERSFEQQRFERETAKDSEQGGPLRERAADQNERMLKRFDELVEETGGQEVDPGAAGRKIVDPILKKAERAKAEIRTAYDDARAVGDMDDPIDYQPIREFIDEQGPTAQDKLAPVLKMVDEQLARNDPDGSGSVPINALEDVRKAIRKAIEPGTPNEKFGTDMIRLIDQATEGKGGELYKHARKLYRDYAAEFKNQGAIRDLIHLKRGTTDRKVAYEDVVRKTVTTGSVDDLNNVKRTLTSAGDDGLQAWREVQGQAMRWINDEATKNVARDVRGNAIVSPAKLGAAVRALDKEGKLEILFGKKGAETLRDLDDISKDLFTSPPGAVNTSNTASVVKEAVKWMTDSAVSLATTGVPVPLVMGGKALLRARADRKVRGQVKEALGEGKPVTPLLRRVIEQPVAAPVPPPKIPTGLAREIDMSGRAPLLRKLPVPDAKEGGPGDIAAAVVEQAKKPAKPLPAGEARELDDIELNEWAREFGLGSEARAEALRIDRALQQDAGAVERAAVQHAKQPTAFARAIDRILDKAPDETVTPASREGSEGLPGARRGEEGGRQGQPVGEDGTAAAAQAQAEVDPDPIRRLAAETAARQRSDAARALAGREAKPLAPPPKPGAVDPESLIVNPIDPALPKAEKIAALAKLTAENKPIIDAFLRQLDAELGTVSKSSVKEDDKIGAKASRPAILAKKPWHDVEHIRDSFRFKTVLDSIEQLPEIATRLQNLGAEVIKADVDKVLRPKEFGWRIAAFDLRMPNGQLAEFYMPVKELEHAKKNGGHQLFEEARDLDVTQPEQLAQYDAIAERSRAHYEKAWQAYLTRTGVSGNDVRAALSKALAPASSSRVKSASASAVVRGAGDVQAPAASRRAENDPATTSASRDSSATQAATLASAPTRQIVAEMPAGRESVTYTDRGDEVRVIYRLADVGDLVTSHDNELRVNPAFPAELQPRDRTRADSEMQITRMANGLRPEFLGGSPKASDGAPIVGLDGVVESGNARTIAVRRAYRDGKADGYRAWLEKNAADFGLSPEDVRKAKAPLLIRQGVPPYDRAEFARRANESSVQALSDTEQASVDAKRLPELDKLELAEDGGIDLGRSREFVADFARIAVAPSERNRFFTGDGELSIGGAQRIRNAIFAKAYGDSDVTALLAESTDSGVKNILAGMLRAAGRVASVRDLMEAGARAGRDFAPDLIDAVRRYVRLRRDGKKVEQSLAEGALFGDGPSAEVQALMRQLELDSRAPRRVADMVQRMADEIDAGGDPRQATLMEPRAPYGKLADDLDGQQRFLDDQARAAGFQSLDEFVAGDFAGFMRAAEQWREKNPAMELHEPSPAGSDRSSIIEQGGKFFVRIGDDRASHGPMKTRADAEAYAQSLLSIQTPADLKAKAERQAAAQKADAAAQKRLADKAAADAQRDEFTLTGSNRDVDVAEAAGQASLFDREAPYSTDLFGETVAPPPKQFKPLLAKREAKPNDTAAPAGEYFVRTVIGTPTKRRIGATRIVSADDAAAATAYLYRSPVERFDGIVTDERGKPLAIIGGFKGAIGETSVYPPTLLAEAVRVPGAAKVWFSHNHPSGSAALSRADEHIADQLRTAFDGSGIDVMGLLAVTGKKYAAKMRGHVSDAVDMPAPRGDMEVDIVERELRDAGNRGDMIDSPARAKDQAAMFYSQAKRPGLLLADSQHRASAWMPIPTEAEGQLKGTGGLRALYRAVSEANAPTAFIVHGGELDKPLPNGAKVHQNIANALRQAGVRVLDTINPKTGESAAERGTEAPPFSAVYSIGALTAAGAAAAAATRNEETEERS